MEGLKKFHGAILDQDIRLVESQLSRARHLVNFCDPEGRTGLHLSCLIGNWEMTRLLLEFGADVTATMDDDSMAIHVAAENGQNECLSLLIERGSPISPKNVGETPLHRAIAKNHVNCIKILMRSSADPAILNDKNAGDRTDKADIIELITTLKNQQVEFALDQLHHGLPFDPRQLEPTYIKTAILKALVDFSILNKITEFKTKICNTLFTQTLSLNSKKITDQIINKIDFSLLSPYLVELDLSFCALTFVPPALIACSLLDRLNLEGNMIQGKFAEMSNNNLLNYLEKVRKNERIIIQKLKLIFVGPPNSGKTSLLFRFRNMNPQEQRRISTTDGINFQKIAIRGFKFKCWDFGGQSRYKSIHQLFLTDHSIALVHFNLTTPIDISISQITFWLQTISQRCKETKIILVGTHASLLSEGLTKEIFRHVSSYFQGLFEFLGPIQIDSYSNFNISELATNIYRTAQSMALNTPASLDMAKETIRNLAKSVNPAFLPITEVYKHLSYVKSPETQSLCLQILDRIGSISLLTSYNYDTNTDKPTRRVMVALDPHWIVKVMSSVVSFRHKFSRFGVVKLEELYSLGDYNRKLYPFPLILEILTEFDILSRFNEQSYLVPCLFPTSVPNHLSDSSVGLIDCQTFRRSYLVPKMGLPDRILGRILASVLKLGKCVSAWKGGCVVVFGGTTNGGIIRVWNDTETSADEDIFHVVVISPFSSFLLPALGFSLSFVSRVVLPEQENVNPLDILKQIDIQLRALFQDFYKISCRPVVPLSEQCLDWWNMDTVYQALCDKDEWIGSEKGFVQKRVKDVCPEMTLVDIVRTFRVDEFEIQEEEKGKEDSSVHLPSSLCFATLSPSSLNGYWKGNCIWVRERAVRKGEGKKGELGVPIMFREFPEEICDEIDDEKEEEESQEEMKEKRKSSTLKKLRKMKDQLYAKSIQKHPNLLPLLGICTKPVRLIFKYGGQMDLATFLTDPLHFLKNLYSFRDVLESRFLRQREEGVPFSAIMGAEVSNLWEWQNSVSLPSELSAALQSYLDVAQDSWKLNNLSMRHELEPHFQQCQKIYLSLLPEIAPLSKPYLLRIALDVTSGISHLHCQTPPCTQHELTASNIFLKSPSSSSSFFSIFDDTIVAQIDLVLMADFLDGSLISSSPSLRDGTQRRERKGEEEEEEERKVSAEMNIYCLGLLLWEIRYREDPFSFQKKGIENKKGTRSEIKGKNSVIITEPVLQKNDDYDNICRDCWNKTPSLRPTAQQIYARLASICLREFPHLQWKLEPSSLSPDDSSSCPSSSSPPSSPPLSPSSSLSLITKLQNQPIFEHHKYIREQTIAIRAPLSSFPPSPSRPPSPPSLSPFRSLSPSSPPSTSSYFRTSSSPSSSYPSPSTSPLSITLSESVSSSIPCYAQPVEKERRHRIQCLVWESNYLWAGCQNGSLLALTSSFWSLEPLSPNPPLSPFRPSFRYPLSSLSSSSPFRSSHSFRYASSPSLSTPNSSRSSFSSPPPSIQTIFASDYWFSDRSMIRSLASIPGYVWTGSENGRIQVWESFPKSGIDAAQQLQWRGTVEIKTDRILSSFKSSELSLNCGELEWVRDSSFFGGQSDPICVGNIHSISVLDSVCELVLKPPQRAKYFIRFAKIQEAVEFAHKIAQSIEFLDSEFVLWKVTERSLKDQSGQSTSIMSLASVDGSVWSVDSQWRVMSWDLELDAKELEKRIVLKNNIAFDPSTIPTKNPVPGVIVRVGLGEVWIAIGDCFALVRYNDLESPPMMVNETIFQANYDNERAGSLIITAAVVVHCGGAPREKGEKDAEKCRRVEVWTADNGGNMYIWDVDERQCVYHFQWNKSEPSQNEAKEGRDAWSWSSQNCVISMGIVDDEVWCGTRSGVIFRVSILTKAISKEYFGVAHQSTISAICWNGKTAWTSAMDSTLCIWKREKDELF